MITHFDKSSLILDFFSGSATTAHAVMQLNAEDGGNRKYIMVQLPEKTAEDSEAYKAGYRNICEIGKERIRRAGKKIQEEMAAKQKEGDLFAEQGETRKLDTGFRVLRLDDSNMQDVYFQPKDLKQGTIDFLEDNVKPDRSHLDLLFGCMIDWCIPLSLPLKDEKVDHHHIYTVNNGDLVACFDEDITPAVVSAMADKEPLRVIFRDSCFATDDAKINIYEQFKQKLGWTDADAYKNIRVI